MKLLSLSSQNDGAIATIVLMSSGDRVDVTFTTVEKDGLTLASPDKDIFDQESLNADEVRKIIAAVTSFERVAAYSRGKI